MVPRSEAVAKFISDVDWSLYAGAEYGFVAWQKDGTLFNLACRIIRRETDQLLHHDLPHLLLPIPPSRSLRNAL